MSRIVAAYVDQTSEEMVAAYTQEREHWPVRENRQDVELALQVSYWLGPGVLRPATPSPARAGATRSSWLIASS